MTDGKMYQRTIRPTHQWSTEAIVKTFFGSFDRLSAHQKVWHFLAAGVPISSKRRRNRAGAADSGTQDCVYCEASDKFDSPSQTTGQINGRIAEQRGDASLRKIPQRTREWLRNLIEEFRRNISLTGRLGGSFLKSIACWFPKEKNFITRKKHV